MGKTKDSLGDVAKPTQVKSCSLDISISKATLPASMQDATAPIASASEEITATCRIGRSSSRVADSFLARPMS